MLFLKIIETTSGTLAAAGVFTSFSHRTTRMDKKRYKPSNKNEI